MSQLSTESILYFHLISLGRNGERVFHSDEDRWEFLRRLKRSIEDLKLKLLSWTLMGNHVHLLVATTDRALVSELLKRVNGGFARRFNGVRLQRGAVWQPRPRILPVVFESYFQNCQLYIEANSVGADLESDPVEYPWSSCRYYARGVDDGLTTASPWFLGLDSEPAGRQQAYRTIMKEWLRRHGRLGGGLN